MKTSGSIPFRIVLLFLLAFVLLSPQQGQTEEKKAGQEGVRQGQTGPEKTGTQQAEEKQTANEKAGAGQNRKKTLKLTLADCVVLALKNNLDIKSSFLDRITQRFDLKVAKYEFEPQSSIVFSSLRSSVNDDNTGRTTGSTYSGTWAVSLKVPTGGSFNFSWANQAQQADISQSYSYNPNWTLTYTQPLLKGGGIDVATANLKIAGITEDKNLLGLKDTLSNMIGQVISAYRSYLQTIWQLEISQKSLEQQKKSYDSDKALVRAGRKAPSELIESESNIASYEINIVQQKNTIQQQMLALLQLLNIDSDIIVEPVKETLIFERPPSLQDALEIAFKKRTDHVGAVKDVQVADLNYTVAKNNRLWDLQLQTGVGSNITRSQYWSAFDRAWSVGKSDWNVGATLTIPLRDLTIEQTYITNKIAMEKAKLALKKVEIGIEIDIKNAIRDLEIKRKLVGQQRRATDLARKKYENEQEKFKVGRTTNFQLLTYQNELVTAQVNEANSVIDYLNSLTTLDQKLGTMLDTWHVEVRKLDERVKTPPVDSVEQNF